MPKVYFQDTGLRNALINRFSPLRERSEKGALLENYVYLRLKELYDHESIRFWRTSEGHEIDFVITSDFKTGEAYEVKFGKFDNNRYQYKKFAKNYPGIIVEGINYQKAVYL